METDLRPIDRYHALLERLTPERRSAVRHTLEMYTYIHLAYFSANSLADDRGKVQYSGHYAEYALVQYKIVRHRLGFDKRTPSETTCAKIDRIGEYLVSNGMHGLPQQEILPRSRPAEFYQRDTRQTLTVMASYVDAMHQLLRRGGE